VIRESILAAAAEFRTRFQTARPFKHVCIDDFLTPEAAEQALADFPAFDRGKAINEFGEVGGKAVNTNLRAISPFYARLYDELFSEAFLSQMSSLTGIPDLIADPTMYGGGTHENLHGQELDPHVDFNYVSGGQAHRRINLLIYLNKDWDPDWGGALEVHSNPREPDSNAITAYDLKFNRAIMFETNEYSWHGFPRINLPPAERGRNSRKCLSIYLYTRDRPASEIAGTHGTFYVQRPISPRIQAGHVLTEEDVTELRRGMRHRDRSIEAYQKMEERFGRERDGLHRYLEEILASVRLPVIGHALQLRRLAGMIWHDGWCGEMARFEMRAVAAISSIELFVTVPQAHQQETEITLGLEAGASLEVKARVTETSLSLRWPVTIPAGTVFQFMLACSTSMNPRKLGKGEDDRNLAMLVSMVKFL